MSWRPGLVDGEAASVGEVRMGLLEHAQLLVSVAASIIEYERRRQGQQHCVEGGKRRRTLP